jgi:cbb3-type cytochrome oxidase subunit 3
MRQHEPSTVKGELIKRNWNGDCSSAAACCTRDKASARRRSEGSMFDQALPAELSQYMPDVLETYAEMVGTALFALPVAAILGAALAFRPKRRGTPERSAPVIQTQIMLAVMGAVIMLIVGASLARAFGIVGAANLIRYRSKIEDPKDAVVMLSTLSLGLATGVGLYGLAVFSTVFILGVLWLIESFEPTRRKAFQLKVIAKDPDALRSRVEAILQGHKVKYELRTAGAEELCYATKLLLTTRTDSVSNAILALQSDVEKEVAWEETKS